MSERAIERALARLQSKGAVLAPMADGKSYGVYPGGDRRRRPLARLLQADVRALSAEGALAAGRDGAFVLSAAGRARVSREQAGAEGFFAQHAPLEERRVIDASGSERRVRGLVRSAALAKLAALRDANGAPWLSGAELDAAQHLRRDWEASQEGLVRGSDCSAPPIGSSARGASNAQERTMAARCDARRRVGEALDGLAQPARRVVERVCLYEDGLEALERAEGWPSRSAKVALKLGLAQLAQTLGLR